MNKPVYLGFCYGLSGFVDLVKRGRQPLLEYIGTYLQQHMNPTAEICD